MRAVTGRLLDDNLVFNCVLKEDNAAVALRASGFDVARPLIEDARRSTFFYRDYETKRLFFY